MLYRLFSAVAASVVAFACTSSPSQAQAAWPKEKTIRWLVGVAPGGGADPITRAVTERLSRAIGATIVVENKPGGNQSIAANELARSEPDGYTIMTVAGPTLYSQPVPEIGNGLDPVAHLSTGPLLLAGTTKRNLADLRSLIAAMKDKPDDWSYGTAGVATVHHIAGELINTTVGAKMEMVPYRGGAIAVNDAIAGHIPLIIIGIGPLIPHVQSNALRGYGVTAKERFPLLPAVPTIAEAGLPGLELSQNFGVAVRSGTPKELVEQLNREINAILATEEIKNFFLSQGAIAQHSTPEQWGDFYAAKKKEMSALAKRLGIEVLN
ncbi:tripartite-type tricarboxylate transporter receptor subunit TctC [Bradyrhizobium sp. AZCC 1719]|uniref:Bug family tripartite tricarboxylate transporter substrate binding protein n=1 Tax=Bradyrhizobium sp. AZCC 1719 TaxID=3117028 RepID=UPI002FF359CB